MTLLRNRHWINLDGEPVTGRVPPRVIVYGPKMTGRQQGEVAHIYKLFTDVCLVAVGEYQVRNRRLADGTRVRCTSFMGQDKVEVWTPEVEEEVPMLGGYAFRCVDEAVRATTYSRLATQSSRAPAARKYKFFARESENYGEGRWHGKEVKRPGEVPLALSWAAGTAYWKMAEEPGGSEPAYRETFDLVPAYANLAGVGTGTKLYFKSLVALDLADPELTEIVPFGSDLQIEDPVDELRIQGAGMSDGYINVVASWHIAAGDAAISRPIFLGSVGGVPTYSTGQVNYRLYFLRFKYRLTPVGEVHRLSVSKQFEVLAKIDDDWIQAHKLDWEALAETEAPAGFLHYTYGTHDTFVRPLTESLLIPVSLWKFDETGTRAHALFTESRISERACITLEFNAPETEGAQPELTVAEARMAMGNVGGSSTGEILLAPGGVNFSSVAREETIDVTGDGGLQELLGFESVATGLDYVINPNYGGAAWGMTVAVDFDGTEAVRAELATTAVEIRAESEISVSRPDVSSTDWSLNRVVKDKYNRTESLIFYREGVEVSRFVWGEVSSNAEFVWVDDVTTVGGAPIVRRFPAHVLFVDPVSESAAWIELHATTNMQSSYSTPNGLGLNPIPVSEYKQLVLQEYIISPLSVSMELRLRVISAGVEQPHQVLGSRVQYIQSGPPEPRFGTTELYHGIVPFSSTTIGPEETNASQGNDEFALFSRVFDNSFYYTTGLLGNFDHGQTVLPVIKIGKAAASYASYYDDHFFSMNTAEFGNVGALVQLPNSLQPDTIAVTNTLYVNALGGGDPVIATGQQAATSPWFEKLSIY